MRPVLALKRFLVPRGLFGRSLLIVLLPLLILQLVLTVVFYDRHWSTVARWLAFALAGEVALVAEMVEEADDAQARQDALDRARRHFRFALSFEPGGELAAAARVSGFLPQERVDPEVRAAFDRALDRPFALDTRPDELQQIAIYVQLEHGLLRVLAPRKRIDTNTTNLFMLWMLGASALLLAIAIFFLLRQIRPIRSLAQAAESFGKGRDVGDFKLQGASEIRQAAFAFNVMRERILRQMSQRTEMLAAVSHDLRTPLTRMRLELEMMHKLASADSDTAQAVSDLRADVQEMTRLVEAYLGFARGEGQESMTAIELGPLLQEVAERGRRGGTRIEVALDRPIRLQLRPLAFRRCLANLIDNAGRYGHAVEVTAEDQGEAVEIRIDDDGPGIPEAQRDEVFKPFHRLEPSRNMATGGIGLGLTIARDVVLSHGGDIKLGESPKGGLRATLRLPH
jgi:two-component system, OmpR family, osmolarity sensor histidine kinase EnvZ